jgi:hypothetical protein
MSCWRRSFPRGVSFRFTAPGYGSLDRTVKNL